MAALATQHPGLVTMRVRFYTGARRACSTARTAARIATAPLAYVAPQVEAEAVDDASLHFNITNVPTIILLRVSGR